VPEAENKWIFHLLSASPPAHPADSANTGQFPFVVDEILNNQRFVAVPPRSTDWTFWELVMPS
jgi:hypothetical protein